MHSSVYTPFFFFFFFPSSSRTTTILCSSRVFSIKKFSRRSIKGRRDWKGKFFSTRRSIPAPGLFKLNDSTILIRLIQISLEWIFLVIHGGKQWRGAWTGEALGARGNYFRGETTADETTSRKEGTSPWAGGEGVGYPQQSSLTNSTRRPPPGSKRSVRLTTEPPIPRLRHFRLDFPFDFSSPIFSFFLLFFFHSIRPPIIFAAPPMRFGSGERFQPSRKRNIRRDFAGSMRRPQTLTIIRGEWKKKKKRIDRSIAWNNWLRGGGNYGTWMTLLPLFTSL